MQVSYSLRRSSFCFYIILFSMKQDCQRVQTAQYFRRQKHQMALIKEIKSLYMLNSHKTTHLKSCHTPGQSKSRILNKKRTTTHSQASLHDQIHEIQKIRGKKKKSKYSFDQDQKNICANGWLQFGQKVDRSVEHSLNRARQRVRNLKKRATVSTIFLKEGVRPVDAEKSMIGQQKIRDIWKLSKGGNQSQEKFFRLSDLSKGMKNSVVFKNAYQACLHSKSYTQSMKKDLKHQKLSSFVYLNENQLKLPQKQINELMRDNFFMA